MQVGKVLVVSHIECHQGQSLGDSHAGDLGVCCRGSEPQVYQSNSLAGVPIGGSICGLYGGTCFGLVIVFDDRAEQLSPGVILQLMMMRTAIEGGARALNLLRGFSYYKQHWLAQPLPTGNGQLYRIGKPWFWRAIVGDFRRKVTQLVAASPAFNPDRRAGEQKPAPIAATAAEQKELSAILARLSGARVERLGPRELAAVLPFGENTQPGEEPAAPALH